MEVWNTVTAVSVGEYTVKCEAAKQSHKGKVYECGIDTEQVWSLV